MFFAAASAISISQLPPRFVQDSLHFVSYTITISSMASLFFALLVGCVVNHAHGVRRIEVNWGTKCANFGAKKRWWPLNTCECPYELPLPRNCRGRPGRYYNPPLNRTFDLERTIKTQSLGCHCEDPCPQYGAKRELGQCRCPKDRPRPSKDCGAYMDQDHIDEHFALDGAQFGCRCLTEAEYEVQR